MLINYLNNQEWQINNFNSSSPIGIFDSGLGGLTAVKELKRILPNESIIYFGDTGRVPYGTRSPEIIKKYAVQDISFLLNKNVKFIIAACGTVSSVACEIGDTLPVQFTGVLEPTVKSAINSTKNKKIGVIGTSATIKSQAFFQELKKIDKSLEIFQQDCPLFVPLVENGITSKNDIILQEITRRYLINLKNQEIDTLILGCTHYPIIKESIQEFFGEQVKIIDSGKETALYARKVLKDSNLLNNTENNFKYYFYVSDSCENFKNEAKKFLNLQEDYFAEKINIDEY